jgi:hypothetical protein
VATNTNRMTSSANFNKINNNYGYSQKIE